MDHNQVSKSLALGNHRLMSTSKPLGHDDESGFSFVREILQGDPTYAINFDRLQQHPKLGYLIFEFLLCEEVQVVTPNTSHPNKYWYKNSRKFIEFATFCSAGSPLSIFDQRDQFAQEVAE